MKTPPPLLTDEEHIARLSAYRPKPAYMAMFSTLTGGITKNSELMWVPVDEHQFHRGDGVFEAFLCIDGALYDLQSHLERLKKSADGIELELPMSLEDIAQCVIATSKASGARNHTVRMYVSRGPGSFTANPYDCIGSQLYIIADKSGSYAPRYFEEGAKVGISKYVAKEVPFCNIKSCNYLLNAMLKKEAVDAGVDYMIPIDVRGCMTEGSTENIAMIDKDGVFKAPLFERMLRGTTLIRVMELAKEFGPELGITRISQEDLTVADFENAKEIIMVGTTMGVMPVGEFNGKAMPDVKDENSCWKKLRAKLIEERASAQKVRTVIF
ncbi:peptidase [bacterium]|nr:peptidase [bacterium]